MSSLEKEPAGIDLAASLVGVAAVRKKRSDRATAPAEAGGEKRAARKRPAGGKSDEKPGGMEDGMSGGMEDGMSGGMPDGALPDGSAADGGGKVRTESPAQSRTRARSRKQNSEASDPASAENGKAGGGDIGESECGNIAKSQPDDIGRDKCDKSAKGRNDTAGQDECKSAEQNERDGAGQNGFNTAGQDECNTAGQAACDNAGQNKCDNAGRNRSSTVTVGRSVESFEEFGRAIFPFLDLKPFHRTYYRVLEAFARKKIRKLMISMPPQHGKSMGATTLLPAYLLGLNPDLRVAIASYSASLASKFNRRVQRILESKEYGEIFPETTIKRGTRPPEYIRTSDEVEIIGREGSLLSVGREGSLTGNRVDCFILDDLYKDALEANSPLVRENCREWYTSVVKTRMHNDSSELLVFTRWHEEDLIGDLQRMERVIGLREWKQLDDVPDGVWVALNFEAVKQSEPTQIDPRQTGEALWPERQSIALLEAKRRLDPVRFEAMYQGHPSAAEGLLYGNRFQTYDTLPETVHHVGNYTDTADTGDDYLCSLCYVAGADGALYITDAVYTREPMEVTETAVSEMLRRNRTRRADIESNNGGRGFARAVQRLAPEVSVNWFHQSGNKEARILSHSATVLHRLRWPADWPQRWPELHAHLVTYRRKFSSNRWHDAADVVTGIIEREAAAEGKRGGRVKFL